VALLPGRPSAVLVLSTAVLVLSTAVLVLDHSAVVLSRRDSADVSDNRVRVGVPSCGLRTRSSPASAFQVTLLPGRLSADSYSYSYSYSYSAPRYSYSITPQWFYHDAIVLTFLIIEYE
jgi:hypothetical protein